MGDLVPRKNEVWHLYILLHTIIDICCSRYLQPECHLQLNKLVSEHNELFMLISKFNLKPKYHFLLHYGLLLIKNGPIILTSTIRFEAKHKTIKAIANAIPCRINLGHTLSHKIQLQMVNRLLSRTGLELDLKFTSSSFNKVSSNESFDLPSEFEFDTFSLSWLEYRGIKYKSMLLVLEVISGECLFGEILHMFLNNKRIPYFIVRPLSTVGFDPHFFAFEVKSTNLNSKNIGYYITELPDTTPSVSRILSNGKLYVTLRTML